MAKYSYTSISSNSDINSELSKISTAVNDALDRKGVSPNQMEADLDMNSNDILNAGAVGVDSLSINGTLVVPTGVVTTTLPDQAGNSGKFLTTNGSVASWGGSLHGEIDLADYVTDTANASAEINTAAAAALSAGKALVSYDTSITYVLTTGVPINLEGLKYINIKAKIDTTALDTVTTTGCVLLGKLALTTGGMWLFNDIISSNPTATSPYNSVNTATDYPQVRINGTKSITMHFINVRYLQFYQTNETNNPGRERSANAYNMVYFGARICKLEVTSDTKVSSSLWFNENRFYGGRIYKTIFSSTGSYGHNHNHFYQPLFENIEFELDIQVGHSNHWHDVRMESISAGAGVSFAAGTSHNTITRTWSSSHTGRESVVDLSSVITLDDGLNNSFRRSEQLAFNPHTVLNISPSLMIVSDGTTSVTNISSCTTRGVLDGDLYQVGHQNVRPVIPCLETIVVPSSYAGLGQSQLIPVKYGSTFSISGYIDSGFWRWQVQVFDTDGIALDDNTVLESNTATYYADGLWSSSDLNTQPSNSTVYAFNVKSATVGYVRIMVGTGSALNTVIRSITAIYHEPAESYLRAVANTIQTPKTLNLIGKPVIGWTPQGTMVGTTTGTWENVFELSTKATSEVANGATSITVDDITNETPSDSLVDGCIVGISLDDGTMHWSTVSSLSTKTFTIDALVSPVGTSGAKALAGATVVFNRWQQFLYRPEEDSVAVGRQAMLNSTVANVNNCAVFGAHAGKALEGDYNTVIGGNSAPNVTGNYNTVIGGNSGLDITSGQSNFIGGYLSTAGSASAANRIVIGTNVAGTANDQFSFGKISNVVSNDFGTDALWSRASDVRKKENIEDSQFGLSLIRKLRPVEFNWKEGWGNTDVTITGLIAQEVEEALGDSEFIGHVVKDDGYQELKLEAFIPVLINAVKELAAKVEELENQ